ncbi:hypothetical protein VTI74DRAFT_815 [Chaetomium olivicolor]
MPDQADYAGVARAAMVPSLGQGRPSRPDQLGELSPATTYQPQQPDTDFPASCVPAATTYSSGNNIEATDNAYFAVGGLIFARDVMARCEAMFRKTQHVKQLLKLKPEQDLALNNLPHGEGYRELNWKRAANLEAFLMQIMGNEAEELCQSCEKGNGPFKGCILSPTSCGNGACANCHYNSESTRCTFHQASKEKNLTPQKRGQARKEGNTDNLTGDDDGSDPFLGNPLSQKRQRLEVQLSSGSRSHLHRSSRLSIRSTLPATLPTALGPTAALPTAALPTAALPTAALPTAPPATPPVTLPLPPHPIAQGPTRQEYFHLAFPEFEDLSWSESRAVASVLTSTAGMLNKDSDEKLAAQMEMHGKK